MIAASAVVVPARCSAQAATVRAAANFLSCNPCPAAKFLISYQRDSTVELDQNPNFFLSSRHLQVLPGVSSFPSHLRLQSLHCSTVPPSFKTLAIPPRCARRDLVLLFPFFFFSLFCSSFLFFLFDTPSVHISLKRHGQANACRAPQGVADS